MVFIIGPQLDYNSRPVFESSSVCQTAVGGLSMTGCLSDFSLYIFHPYGGAKKAGEYIFLVFPFN